MLPFRILFPLLLALMVMELLAFPMVYADGLLAPLLHTGAGVAIGLLFYFFKEHKEHKEHKRQLPHKIQLAVLTVWGLLLLNWLLNIFRVHYQTVQIGIGYADMLPTIDVMCSRFLSGAEVYERIPEIFNSNPPYLPAMWVPYLIPLSAHLDLRWTNLVCLLLALAVPLWYSIRANVPFVLKAFMLVVLSLFVQLITASAFEYTLQTEEAVVLFYYTMLALSIYRRNPYFIGIAAGFCLLSRYTLLFWFVVFCIALLVQKQHRQFALKVILSSAITGFLLLLLTGSLDRIAYFINVPKEYLKIFEARAADAVAYAETLKYTIGLRKFTVNIPFQTYLRATLALNVLLPVLLFVAKRKELHNRWVLFGTAKICLTVFLATVVHPYGYLFYTNVLFSFVGVAAVMNHAVWSKND